jgi:hypothetical protein
MLHSTSRIGLASLNLINAVIAPNSTTAMAPVAQSVPELYHGIAMAMSGIQSV